MSVWKLLSTLSNALLGIMAETPDRYTPSVEDILAVKQTLVKKGKLPLELVDTIIDFAEYWVKSTTCRTNGEISIRAGRERENMLLLRSYPLGYVPTKGNPVTLPMTIVDEYPSIPPEPRLETGDFPNNVTQEVINYWTQDAAPRGEFPCRKIVFTIKSHDQGWGGPPGCRGTYKGSSTWFDVGLETLSALYERHLIEYEGKLPMPYFYVPNPKSTNGDSESIMCTTRTITPPTQTRTIATDPPPLAEPLNPAEPPTTPEPPEIKVEFRHDQDPGLDCLQKNKTGTRDATEHVITWFPTDNTDPDSVDGVKLDEQGRGRATANGEYVRNLKVGDVVTVWGKARYGGWVNTVEEVKIEVYWAV